MKGGLFRSLMAVRVYHRSVTACAQRSGSGAADCSRVAPHAERILVPSMRSFCWIVLIAGPLVFLGLHCGSMDASKGFGRVLTTLTTARAASIPDVAWGSDQAGDLVKLQGKARAAQPLSFPLIRGGAPLAYYDVALIRRYDDGDDTETETVKTWAAAALEVVEGTDARLAVDVSSAWLHVDGVSKLEVSARRAQFLGSEAWIEHAGLRVPVGLRGGDKFWFEARWVEVGAPLFVVGVIEQRGDVRTVRGPPGQKAIVSVRDEAATRAYLEEHRDDGAFWSKVYLALAPLSFLLALAGLFYFDD
jgi:hypothetical protein